MEDGHEKIIQKGRSNAVSYYYEPDVLPCNPPPSLFCLYCESEDFLAMSLFT